MNPRYIALHFIPHLSPSKGHPIHQTHDGIHLHWVIDESCKVIEQIPVNAARLPDFHATQQDLQIGIVVPEKKEKAGPIVEASKMVISRLAVINAIQPTNIVLRENEFAYAFRAALSTSSRPLSEFLLEIQKSVFDATKDLCLLKKAYEAIIYAQLTKVDHGVFLSGTVRNAGNLPWDNRGLALKEQFVAGVKIFSEEELIWEGRAVLGNEFVGPKSTSHFNLTLPALAEGTEVVINILKEGSFWFD